MMQLLAFKLGSEFFFRFGPPSKLQAQSLWRRVRDYFSSQVAPLKELFCLAYRSLPFWFVKIILEPLRK